jgi:hypothetical protein
MALHHPTIPPTALSFFGGDNIFNKATNGTSQSEWGLAVAYLLAHISDRTSEDSHGHHQHPSSASTSVLWERVRATRAALYQSVTTSTFAHIN